MNPLALLPLFAALASAGVIAAPGLGLVQPGLQLVNPGLQATVLSAPAIQQVQTIQQIQVPLTQTVHYENRPVVTGYSTQIIKPALGLAAAPVLAAPQALTVAAAPAVAQVAAPAPVAVAKVATVAAAPVAVAAPAPVAVAAPAPVAVAKVATVAAAPVVAQVAAPAPVAVVRKALASDFEPLVTKQAVLAPVRQHTQITPQLTRIEPEVTVRKVVQEVNVPVVSHVQTPVINQVALQAAPALATLQPVAQQVAVQQVAAAPAAVGAQIIQAA